MLYIVGTPIGNLEDITFRAVRTLSEADFIIAEDTRQSGILLKKYDISTPMKSFHGYSSNNKASRLADELKDSTAALITDAGTPGISDPGFKLIQEALAAGVEVVPIPGASAVTTAVSVAGLPVDKFLYLGFLPLKKGRQTLLESISDLPHSIVIYESVHRIGKTLSDLYNALGDREVCVGREMTKMHEEYFRGTLSEAIERFDVKSKGEFTLVIAPKSFKRLQCDKDTL